MILLFGFVFEDDFVYDVGFVICLVVKINVCLAFLFWIGSINGEIVYGSMVIVVV